MQDEPPGGLSLAVQLAIKNEFRNCFWMRVDADLDNLRGHARFEALLKEDSASEAR